MRWYKNITYRVVEGVKIPGVFFLGFIHNFDYHLTTITAYKDSMVDCWGLVSLDEFRNKLRKGWVATSIPNGANISIHHLGWFTASNITMEISENEFLKDVVNAIEELNGRPTAQERLIDAIKRYPKEQTGQLHKQLRQAYCDLPAYCRKYIFGSRMEKYKEIQEIISTSE